MTRSEGSLLVVLLGHGVLGSSLQVLHSQVWEQKYDCSLSSQCVLSMLGVGVLFFSHSHMQMVTILTLTLTDPHHLRDTPPHVALPPPSQGGVQGTELTLWPCNNAANQQFVVGQGCPRHARTHRHGGCKPRFRTWTAICFILA